MRNRAGIILIQDNKLALIERHRSGMHYFAFPGGGIDEGESPQEAAIREAEEELGVHVEIKQKVAEIAFNKRTQYYFWVESLGGEFGTGSGEEYGEYNPAYGTYHPVWMPLADVLNNNVLPRELADLVVRFAKEGWPVEPVIIIEEKR
jgi:8-oxo-dGTP pyrophosphatase MutT (NUDIX family)